MEESLRQQILTAFPQKTVDIRTYSPMALALLIRTIVVSRGNRQAEKLHRETSSLVRASAQAAIGDAIWDMLTPEEQTIYKRGKNSNPSHHTRNASLQDYLKATALECLCRIRTTGSWSCWLSGSKRWRMAGKPIKQRAEQRQETAGICPAGIRRQRDIYA